MAGATQRAERPRRSSPHHSSSLIMQPFRAEDAVACENWIDQFKAYVRGGGQPGVRWPGEPPAGYFEVYLARNKHAPSATEYANAYTQRASRIAAASAQAGPQSTGGDVRMPSGAFAGFIDSQQRFMTEMVEMLRGPRPLANVRGAGAGHGRGGGYMRGSGGRGGHSAGRGGFHGGHRGPVLAERIGGPATAGMHGNGRKPPTGPRKHGRASKPMVHVMVGAAAVKTKASKRKGRYTKRGDRTTGGIATGGATLGGTPAAGNNAALTVDPAVLPAPLVAPGPTTGVIDAVVANEGGVDAEMVDVFEEFVDIEEPVEAPADAEDAISIFGDDEPVEY